jgi:hypothetical protein
VGNYVSVNSIDIFRIAGVEIAEDWNISDDLGLIQQINDLPPLNKSSQQLSYLSQNSIQTDSEAHAVQ